MITIKNITDEEHKNELQKMIHAYYDDSLGKDWTSKIPVKKIREYFDFAGKYTKEDLTAMFGNKKEEERIALGLYAQEDLIGFASVVVFEDNVGGIYQIYVKPEYRHLFTEEFKGSLGAVMALQKELEEYFINKGANEIIVEAPHTMGYLLDLAQDMGFIPKKVYFDATELKKPLK